jgi:hypothetical protein
MHLCVYVTPAHRLTAAQAEVATYKAQLAAATAAASTAAATAAAALATAQ